MVSDTPIASSMLVETKIMRRQAGAMLERLEENRVMIEHRIRQAGRRDPLKAITGHSAFDHAITSARTIIGHLDDLIGEPGGSVHPRNGHAPASTNGGHAAVVGK